MHLHYKETVQAPLERVFEIFSDVSQAANRIDGIETVEVLTEGPIGQGTRFRETRIMFGKPSTEEMEFTEFIPNQKYVVEADTCGSHFRTEFRFNANADATDVEVELTTQATSWFAKLMWPVGKLMAGSMKKIFLADVHQLKSLCENRDAELGLANS